MCRPYINIARLGNRERWPEFPSKARVLFRVNNAPDAEREQCPLCHIGA